ncbi:FAD-binding oxidoreductase [Corynebacterium sp.]|uniref:FAD-binding oxidoreductase n=1 Tax=Corynebacterium sp. TaxID=1720 RepID=UPI0026DC570C|nr:FAD-binding oxidoreductase [Corynebacterium sp.]MDO4609189.1 FAD-binding oxidoreductase [Corynebacterium sp.]
MAQASPFPNDDRTGDARPCRPTPGAAHGTVHNVRTHHEWTPRPLTPVGWFAHEQGVAKLTESFRAIPAGERVRLAKKTSNLFRGRTKATNQGLDVSGLNRVIAVDPVELTADVQGMCTYEDLVDTTLPYGLLPYVVPELKTITLGGAVTGMGVESSAFRSGLPHESVVEMDILTGTGDVVTCSRQTEPEFFRAFPNSYGSLGYAVRLRIRLERVAPYVDLRHVRFHDLDALTAELTRIVDDKAYDGAPVHYLDGVVFSEDESYLVLGTWADEPAGPPSSYAGTAPGKRIYYRSIQHPAGVLRDSMSIRDYIWRWDTDWFWCSRAFGAQDPRIRRFWPGTLLRSEFYWRLIGYDRRFDIADRIEAANGRPARERVVQDVEVVAERLPEFLRWFLRSCEIQPVWLCPIVLADGAGSGAADEVADAPGASRDDAPRAGRPWPLYPLSAGQTWVNVGFWSSVPVEEGSPAGAFNRRVEAEVARLGGHKSLYSEAFYSEEDFRRLYGGDLPDRMKERWDPDGRFPTLYQKTVGGS